MSNLHGTDEDMPDITPMERVLAAFVGLLLASLMVGSMFFFCWSVAYLFWPVSYL